MQAPCRAGGQPFGELLHGVNGAGRTGRAASVLVGVRQQRQVAGPLDRHRQLALVERSRSGDTAGHDLSGLGDVALERPQIFIVDLVGTFFGELTELFSTEKT